MIIGQQGVVDRALIAILTRGHALIEGVPGVAKTLLVKSLAHLFGCSYQRIQFTPDLNRNDIIGASVFHPETNEYVFSKGPIFTAFLLADEVNRAPARAQSTLLEAMQERHVTIERRTFKLSRNFTVFATQNPLEAEGTFPLPEAQLDRFVVRITMEYPEEEDEIELARRVVSKDAPEALLEQGVIRPVLTAEQLLNVRGCLEQVAVPSGITRYVVDIVRSTREHTNIKVGAGPRATQALTLASRAHAGMNGRAQVGVEDVQAVALGCLEHRIILYPKFEEEGLTPKEVVEHILRTTPEPRR